METKQFFKSYGDLLCEAMALWVGKEMDNIFRIQEVWFPDQANSLLNYEVSALEVHRIQVDLNNRNFIAMAQVHTHPMTAYHSKTDDEHPIVYLPGSLSIVFPNFGNIPGDKLNLWAVFRLNNEKWVKLTKKKVKKLFKLI